MMLDNYKVLGILGI